MGVALIAPTLALSSLTLVGEAAQAAGSIPASTMVQPLADASQATEVMPVPPTLIAPSSSGMLRSISVQPTEGVDYFLVDQMGTYFLLQPGENTLSNGIFAVAADLRPGYQYKTDAAHGWMIFFGQQLAAYPDPTGPTFTRGENTYTIPESETYAYVVAGEIKQPGTYGYAGDSVLVTAFFRGDAPSILPTAWRGDLTPLQV